MGRLSVPFYFSFIILITLVWLNSLVLDFFKLANSCQSFLPKNLLLDKISVKAASSALDTGLQHDRWVSDFTVKENSYVAPELVLH